MPEVGEVCGLQHYLDTETFNTQACQAKESTDAENAKKEATQ